MNNSSYKKMKAYRIHASIRFCFSLKKRRPRAREQQDEAAHHTLQGLSEAVKVCSVDYNSGSSLCLSTSQACER